MFSEANALGSKCLAKQGGIKRKGGKLEVSKESWKDKTTCFHGIRHQNELQMTVDQL